MVSANLFLVIKNHGETRCYSLQINKDKECMGHTRTRTNSCRTRALLSFGCRSKIKMIYYRLPAPL